MAAKADKYKKVKGESSADLSSDSGEEQEEDEEDEEEEEDEGDHTLEPAAKGSSRVGGTAVTTTTFRRVLLLLLMTVPGVVAAHTVYCVLELHADKEAVNRVRAALAQSRDAAHVAMQVAKLQLAHTEVVLRGVAPDNTSDLRVKTIDEMLVQLAAGSPSLEVANASGHNASAVAVDGVMPITASNAVAAAALVLRLRASEWYQLAQNDFAMRTSMDRLESSVNQGITECKQGNTHQLKWLEIHDIVDRMDPAQLFPQAEQSAAQLDAAQLLALARVHMPAAEALFYMYLRTGLWRFQERFTVHVDQADRLLSQLDARTAPGTASQELRASLGEALLRTFRQNVTKVRRKLYQEWFQKTAKNSIDVRAEVGNSSWSAGSRDLASLVLAMRQQGNGAAFEDSELRSAVTDLLDAVAVPGDRSAAPADALGITLICCALAILGALAAVYGHIAGSTAAVTRSLREHASLMHQLHSGDEGEHQRLMEDVYKGGPGPCDHFGKHHLILLGFACGLAIVFAINWWGLDDAADALDVGGLHSRRCTRFVREVRTLQRQLAEANLVQARFVITGDMRARGGAFADLEAAIGATLRRLDAAADELPGSLRRQAQLRLNTTQLGVEEWNRAINAEWNELEDDVAFPSDPNLMHTSARLEARAGPFLTNNHSAAHGWEFAAHGLVGSFEGLLNYSLFAPHRARFEVCKDVSQESRRAEAQQKVDPRAVIAVPRQCRNFTLTFAQCSDMAVAGQPDTGGPRECNWNKGCQYRHHSAAAGAPPAGCYHVFASLALKVLENARGISNVVARASAYLLTGEKLHQTEYNRLMARLTGEPGAQDFSTLIALNMVHELAELTAGRNWTMENSALVRRAEQAVGESAFYLNNTIRTDFAVLAPERAQLETDHGRVARRVAAGASAALMRTVSEGLDKLGALAEDVLNELEGDTDHGFERRRSELCWVTIAFAWAAAAALILAMKQHQLLV
eukprot:TRINITY_DN16220_c1_g2_i1.p1 TRINITY_DN16220_c1_g2~~TRINITY_DN16220_c1_g2_i1.p1  ORF type:complete len:973 (+),score=374.39 TRINITY_DN16220_c1_g2_i1:98-3016(+)